MTLRCQQELEPAGERRRRRRVPVGHAGRERRRAEHQPRGGEAGPDRAARAASATARAPPGTSRSPTIAPPSASRYVSRASSGSSGSRRLAALASRRPASSPRRCSNAIRPRQELGVRAPELVQRPGFQPLPRARAQRRVRPRRASLRRPRASAVRGDPGRSSTAPIARETPPQRPVRPSPARGPPPARAQLRHPRQDRLPPRPGATRAGRDQPARRSLLPAPGAPGAARAAQPLGRSPSAPTDDESAPCRRSRSGRPTRAGSSAAPVIPSRSAARPRSAGSPRGSAAATNKSRWVSAGSASSRFTKLSSSLPDNDSAAGQREPARQLRGRKPSR